MNEYYLNNHDYNDLVIDYLNKAVDGKQNEAHIKDIIDNRFNQINKRLEKIENNK